MIRRLLGHKNKENNDNENDKKKDLKGGNDTELSEKELTCMNLDLLF